MALDHLLAALARDAEGEAERLLAEARAEAARIRADAQDRAQRVRADSLGGLEADRRAAMAVELAETRRAARRGVLEARAAVVARVFAEAGSRLPALLDDPCYRAALPNHLAEALSCVGGEESVVRCPPALAGTVGASVAGRPGVSVRAVADAPAGVTVETADGAIVVDNTLAGRLERGRRALELLVAARLEAGS